jgi:hypothetical protein
MIYGVLGLALPFLPLGMENPIVPNYEQSATDAFTAVSALILGHLPVLRNLSLVEDNSHQRIIDLPSWVPDYTYAFFPKPLNMIGVGEDMDYRQ